MVMSGVMTFPAVMRIGRTIMNIESKRLEETNQGILPWKKWGPYLSERQWGTVREDYSAHGTAWEYLSHDHARSRAYRWGEDGIGGFSDEQQRLCLAFAFWNGKDPILKERFFGVTGNEGNHGEDVKEYYYYLDSTPTHSYMKMLYKYPQSEFPYTRLVEENRSRGKDQPEFELMDTGLFDSNHYFDIFIEYAKVTPEDVLIRLTAWNRSSDEAVLHVLPHLWFRNTWAFGLSEDRPEIVSPSHGILRAQPSPNSFHSLYCEKDPEFLFCENETNRRRLYHVDLGTSYPKDGINDFIVNGRSGTVNPSGRGTKAAAHYVMRVASGQSETVKLRLIRDRVDAPFSAFNEVFATRKREANEYYSQLQSDLRSDDAKNIQRQAFAGMLWSKQFFYYDVQQWLDGDEGHPPPPESRKNGRNREWTHLNNADVISMPDTWEYPWYAAWDLAFHCIPLAMVDSRFAKDQLVLLTREWYMHPNGQLPAYEWAFGDVNPPVHAWAAWRVYKIDKKIHGGDGDLPFLERIFHKLLLNFTWWVNRKDVDGNNLFQGGFLGLDNIGIFDRSAPLPTGGHIEQSDGTSWMAMYCLNMLRIALELAMDNPVYQDVATKFFEHFLHIAEAMTNLCGCGQGLWDEEDEFYYDVLHMPNGDRRMLKIRSMVGLIPLFAVETLEPETLKKVPDFLRRMEWFLQYRPDLASLVSRWVEPGLGERRLLSLLRGHRMKMLLKRMLDETEFLSDYGIRALSKVHQQHPFVLDVDGAHFSVQYEPGESESNLFGGNSNWRGPIWMPVNFLLIESLQKFHHYYGDEFKIECPTNSGSFMTIEEVAKEITSRLCRMFLKDDAGNRPVFSDDEKMKSDPHFRDYLLFHEYFHGDSGRGVGASHQTGWTGVVAKLLQPRD